MSNIIIQCEVVIASIKKARDFLERNRSTDLELTDKKNICDGAVKATANYPKGPIDHLLELDDRVTNRTYYLDLFKAYCEEAIEHGKSATTEYCDRTIINFKQLAQNITIIMDPNGGTPPLADEIPLLIPETKIAPAADNVFWNQLMTSVFLPGFIIVFTVGMVLLGVTAGYSYRSNRTSPHRKLKKLAREHGMGFKTHTLLDLPNGPHFVFQDRYINCS